MVEEKRHSSFLDWLAYDAGIDILGSIYVGPIIISLIVGVIGLGVYLLASHFIPGVIILYFVLKILAVAVAIAAVIYVIRRLIRRLGWTVSLLLVAAILATGFIFRERAAYRNYAASLEEANKTEVPFIKKAYGFLVTKSAPARRAERKRERQTFLHDYRLVKSKDARKLIATRYFAGVMCRDLDWITGNNLHLEEEFLKDTEYDIDELVRASLSDEEDITEFFEI